MFFLYPRTEKCLVKNQVAEVTQNGLSQLLNWGSPSLLRGLPIESCVIVGHGPEYYHTHTHTHTQGGGPEHSLRLFLSISITLFLPLSLIFFLT